MTLFPGKIVQGEGIFFTLEELLVLFPLLKKNEPLLSDKERQMLVKIEKIIYEHLSIAEIESRLGGTIEYA
ncbi:MAG: hypothetical protein FWG27_03875 [Treponema sp.]|nr:hypothetical protein [Treponema sp.]